MRTSEHDAANLIIVAGALKGCDQRVEQRVRERVARIGLIQRDRRDLVFA